MNKKMPLVSVIIPNYNYLKYLEKCLESVFNQDYTNIEIIVVDDGSTDGSLKYLMSLHNPLKVLQQKNLGVSVARNKGILESNGEFLAFLDADDFWHPSKIGNQMRIILNSNVDLVYSGVTLVESDGVTHIGSIKPEYSGNCAPYFRQYPTKAIITLGASNALFRKSILANSGIMDPKLSISADWDFFRRYCDYGRVDYLEEQLTFYRQHPENMSTNSDSFKSDTHRCVTKMLSDDRYTKSKWDRFRTWFSTRILLTKYKLIWR